MDAIGPASTRPAVRLQRGAMLTTLAIIVTIPVFWLAIQTLLAEWSTAEYSHGPAIVILSAYLFLRALQKIEPDTTFPNTTLPGIAVLMVGLLLGLFGTVAKVGDISAYGLILWIAGLTLALVGLRRGLHLMIPVMLLVFMLPLPQFLYWKLTIWLQLISSEIGVWVIAAAGVPVYLEGNVIDLGVYQLQVAEACSGLRYLIPVMSLGIVLGMLYNGPKWHRWVLVIAAGPITVILNAVRIGIVGLLVNARGIEHAEGFLHAFEGWVIFASCIALLLLVARFLFTTIPATQRPAHMLLIETEGLVETANRFGQITASRRLVVVIVAGFFASGLSLFAQASTPTAIDRQPFVLFPNQVDTWEGTRRTLDPGIAQVLAADDYIDITFRKNTAEPPINLFVAWYLDQADGSSIHSPEVCLPVNGWEVFSFDKHRLNLETTAYGQFDVNRAIIQNGFQRQLVYYWFEQRGRRMTNDFEAKAMVIYDGLAIGRTDGALVRYITDIAPGEDPSVADARLMAFIEASADLLPPFVPF